MLVSLTVRIGSGVKVWGGSFALLLPWGMVWWFLFGLPLRPFFVPLLAFYAPWCVLLPLLSFLINLGELRLGSIVPIRTVFGTMAVLVGSIVAVAVVRNFAGVVIGTGCVWLRMINGLELV